MDTLLICQETVSSICNMIAMRHPWITSSQIYFTLFFGFCWFYEEFFSKVLCIVVTVAHALDRTLKERHG